MMFPPPSPPDPDDIAIQMAVALRQLGLDPTIRIGHLDRTAIAIEVTCEGVAVVIPIDPVEMSAATEALYVDAMRAIIKGGP